MPDMPSRAARKSTAASTSRVPCHSEPVGPAAALAVAPQVQGEHAIAVTGEHLSMPPHAVTEASGPMHEEDRRAVLGWRIPAGEIDAVRGGQRYLAEAGGRRAHFGARRPGGGNRHRDRKGDVERKHETEYVPAEDAQDARSFGGESLMRFCWPGPAGPAIPGPAEPVREGSLQTLACRGRG